MAYELIQELLEAALTGGNIHQYAGRKTVNLTNTDEFKAIQRSNAEFAKKLIIAWDGDTKDWERNPKNFDPLFPKMLTDKAIQKFAPNLRVSDQQLKMLIQLHTTSFPSNAKAPPKPLPNDIWGHERFAREAYEDLRHDLMLLEMK